MTQTIVLDTKCGGRKQDETGYCTIPAGKMTDHPGEGRCNIHSGMINGVPAVGYDIPALEERMLVYLHDPDIISVDREIALLRAYLELVGHYISELKHQSEADTKWIDSLINVPELTSMVNQTTRNIAHLVKTKHDIEMDRKYMVDIRMVHLIFSMVGDILDKAIPDITVRESISRQLGTIALPSPIIK